MSQGNRISSIQVTNSANLLFAVLISVLKFDICIDKHYSS